MPEEHGKKETIHTEEGQERPNGDKVSGLLTLLTGDRLTRLESKGDGAPGWLS